MLGIVGSLLDFVHLFSGPEGVHKYHAQAAEYFSHVMFGIRHSKTLRGIPQALTVGINLAQEASWRGGAYIGQRPGRAGWE